MKVLMFGWEYPPHVFGGLATANFGISEGLHAQGDVEITLCLPRPFGDEDHTYARIVAMNCVPIVYKNVDRDYVKQRIGNLMDPDEYYRFRDHIYADFGYMHVNDLGCMEFAGGYPSNLNEEINNYSIIAGQVARAEEFDIIHAHDWLTYPAGIAAKEATGKPLVVHVHATDFDRSGGRVNPVVFDIEKRGMEAADKVITVSNLTRNTVIEKYGIPADKVVTVYNAVDPIRSDYNNFVHKGLDEKIVTFLGRITMQKGPEFFIEAAHKVLQKMDNVRFVMAGNGDMMEKMVRRAASLKIMDKFSFTGFLRGHDVYSMLRMSDLYVMPSVSEPFGISPLEAMQSNVPVLISYQSGVAEILTYAIKTDFWDVDAMADAMYGVLNYPSLGKMFAKYGKEEVDSLKWENSARQIKKVYDSVVR